MKTTFTILSNCQVTLSDENHSWTPEYSFATLEDALAYCEDQIDYRQQATHAFVFDSKTGEVYAECETEEDDYDDYDDWEGYGEDWNYNEDMGFDPYCGCYTDDC